MRFQVASDLHLERCHGVTTGYGPLIYATSDALILAGDIDRIDKVRQRFCDWPKPVIYVRGNHDSFFTSYEDAIQKAAFQSSGIGFRLLERQVATFPNIRILGCCLWTDFALLGGVDDALLLAKYAGADYRCLRRADGALLSPEDMRREHQLTLAWLSRQLATPFAGKTIVVTHHAPHLRSLDSRFGRSRFDAAFASDLSAIAKRVNLWVHGHVHHSSDYKLNRCRVVCNPAGRPDRPNLRFDPRLVIDV